MSMFPSPLGREYNPGHSTGEPVAATPRPMRWGFFLAVTAAVVMLVTGFVLLGAVGTARTEVPAEVVGTYVMNQRIVAWGNIAAGLAVAALSPQLLHGRLRGWWAGFTVAAIVINALGLFVRVAGPASLVIIALLAFAAVLVYRPVCNRFIRGSRE